MFELELFSTVTTILRHANVRPALQDVCENVIAKMQGQDDALPAFLQAVMHAVEKVAGNDAFLTACIMEGILKIKSRPTLSELVTCDHGLDMQRPSYLIEVCAMDVECIYEMTRTQNDIVLRCIGTVRTQFYGLFVPMLVHKNYDTEQNMPTQTVCCVPCFAGQCQG